MNIADLHESDTAVSAKSILTSDGGTALAIRILKGERLNEHITKIPAMLLCVKGHAEFDNVVGQKSSLLAGDYVLIEPNVKHWVDGIEDCELVLVR